ncbi:MAG TPA: nuclear transport factor 2 family protein [Thermoleophilaceae bacterium]|jgi:hypothetical protein
MAQVETVRGTRIALPPAGGAERHRTLEQRIYVHVPALYRLFTRLIVRLPPRARLRQLVLGRAVVQGYAAANRRDFKVVLIGFDPELEYRPSPQLMAPDLDPIFYGYDGYMRLWQYWLDAFEDIRWEADELLDFGDKLLVTARQVGTGSGSGVAVGDSLFQLYTLRRGLIYRFEDFEDRSEALEAAAR